MLNEFTLAYRDNKKIINAFGEYNGEQLLKNSKRIFGGREQVFFEYGRDETAPVYNDIRKSEKKKITKNKYMQVSAENRAESGFTLIGMFGTDIDTGSARYDVEYANGYCHPLINPKKSMGSLRSYETKKYYSVDLSYILRISRAFTDYDFSVFDGEGLRILKAWIFVMTYGVRHPEEPGLIMIQASKNEYGSEVRNRVLVRNSHYMNDQRYVYFGAPYGESVDEEWALSADDYSKVAALDTIMTELARATPLIRDGAIVPDLIHGSREYGSTTPMYFKDILGMKQDIRHTNR